MAPTDVPAQFELRASLGHPTPQSKVIRMSQPATRESASPDRPAARSRRRFLKDTATVVAGAALGSLALSRSAHAAGNGTIKIGMIGSGGRCAGAATESMQASPDVKLVAMCDLFEDRVRGKRDILKQSLPEQVMVDDDHCFVGFDGYKKVIDAADVVLIACASKFHPLYALAAIQAGKHVFVEKPHGIDPVGTRQIAAACELANKKGLSLLSGLQSRFETGYQETIKRIHDGAIGDVVAMQSMFLRGPYQLEQRPADMSDVQYQYYNWYHFKWLSGDDVPQSLVHNFDRMRWIMKEANPKWAFGLGGRSGSFGEVYGDMFDHDTVVYEYESGARLYALCRTTYNCYNNAGDIVMGSKGTCYLDRCEIRGANAWKFRGERNNPYQAEQAALVEAVQKNEPINSGYHMVDSTMATVMGQMTCYTGQPIEYEEAYNSTLQYLPAPEDASFDIQPPTTPDATGNYRLPMPGTTSVAELATWARQS